MICAAAKQLLHHKLSIHFTLTCHLPYQNNVENQMHVAGLQGVGLNPNDVENLDFFCSVCDAKDYLRLSPNQPNMISTCM